jgi:RNA polymerase sigma factor (sigma-70 family)
MATVKNRINIVDARKNELLKEMFFEQNMGLVYKMAHKYYNINLDFEERISWGNFGLMQAFDTYDENSGYAFSTYAVRCISNAILYENRRSVYKYNKTNLSLNTVVAESESDGDEIALIDVMATPEEEYSRDDYSAVLAVYKLFVDKYSIEDPKMVDVFNMYILENKTTREIAEKYNHNQAHGSRLAAKAIKLIQEIAIEMDVIDSFNFYSKKKTQERSKELKEKENPIKQKALYIILNYPELESHEIGKILNWSAMKVGMVKMSYNKGNFTLPPDDSIKDKVEKYLENKKVFS